MEDVRERGGWDQSWLDGLIQDLDHSTLYALWREKNPREAERLDGFMEKLVKGEHAVDWPVMLTPLGNVLVRAAAACASHGHKPPVEQ